MAKTKQPPTLEELKEQSHKLTTHEQIELRKYLTELLKDKETAANTELSLIQNGNKS